jgi:hypothetical protein
MKPRDIRRPLVALLWILLAGMTPSCSTLGFSPYGEKWRLGYVDEVVVGPSIENVASRPCLAGTPGDEIRSHEFVVVQYPSGRSRKYRTLPMPTSFAPKRGQRVWINVEACADSLRPLTH